MSCREEIQDVFKSMVLSSIPNISVSLICQKVNISRKTFYKYYDNIQDLIHKIIQEDIFIPLTELSTMNHIKVEDSITVLNSMYSSIYNHREFYKKLYYMYPKENILGHCIYQENLNLNKTIFKQIKEKDIEKEYHIHLAAMSGVNLLEKWILDDFSLSSREISEIFYKHVVRAWVELLDQYR